MSRSLIRLPAGVEDDFEVYVNGVLQELDVDYYQDGRVLIFDRLLCRDQISGWRWLLGSIGIGTYRQDDTVDVRYALDGEPRLAHALTIVTEDEDE